MARTVRRVGVVRLDIVVDRREHVLSIGQSAVLHVGIGVREPELSGKAVVGEVPALSANSNPSDVWFPAFNPEMMPALVFV